ncbi:MFS transporter [Actinomadura barringtoniae]|uniref:MFS transporter n=1 Tax=Actinomadura barringtoniae TaxID=1427535 RepID=A0A939PDT7_9ACTN|nr:MFS transporter [Actinomadura barringtoniae]MBO2447409.1 MFS transporter [Actinomadura barringtoniae]
MNVETHTKREQMWVLGLAAVGSFMVVLDMLVVATALSAIHADLGASLQDLEWTVNAYSLSFAVLLMTAAALGDRFGRRRIFAAGLALFGLASAACALSPDVGTLIAARTVQGVGAAMIMPVALGLLNGAFPPERRGWAIGIYGSITALGVLLGPLLGGVVTQGLGWQWIFWLNVPIAAVAIPLVFTRVKEAFGPPARFDLPGLALVTLSAFGLTWGLVRGDRAGWSSAEILVAFVGGAVLLAGFAIWERRAPAPMLPLRLFRSRAFSAGNLAVFFLNASMTGAIFFMAQFQHEVAGHDSLVAGLALLPWGVAPSLLAPLAGSLADRIGERPLVAAGLALQTAGMAWISLAASTDVAYIQLALPMVLSGAGAALAIPASTKAVTSRVAPADIGKASGTFSTMRQLGGAFGVAVMAAVFASSGDYANPQAFSDGFVAAFGAAAILSVVGTLAGFALPSRAGQGVRAASTLDDMRSKTSTVRR